MPLSALRMRKALCDPVEVCHDADVDAGSSTSSTRRLFTPVAIATTCVCILWTVVVVAFDDSGLHGPVVTYSLPLAVTASGLLAVVIGGRVPRWLSSAMLVALVLVLMIASKVA